MGNWGGVDKHIDAVYYYPTEYKADGHTVAWGGFDADGNTIGSTRIMLEVNPLAALPSFWVVAGGGDIARDELVAAYDRGSAFMSLPARAKIPQHPDEPFGPCPAFW